MTRQVLVYDDIDVSSGPGLDLESPFSDARTHADAAQTLSHKAAAAVISSSSSSKPQPDLKRKRKLDENKNTYPTEAPQGLEMGGDSAGEAAHVGDAQVPSSAYNQTFPPKPPHKKGKQNKKKKNNYNRSQGNAERGGSRMRNGMPMHWDDPGAQTMDISYDADGDASSGAAALNVWEGAVDDCEEEDESRELTHEEIWDDSALVAAWDAAAEEYEAMHGKDKNWKKNRKHRSPLWYNIPPEKQVPAGRSNSSEEAKKHDPTMNGITQENGASSTPLNFDTFVPTHDASLSYAQPTQPPPVPGEISGQYNGVSSHYAANVSDAQEDISAVSADDAFNRAIGAMYWCGYWTAVYHVQRAHEAKGFFVENEETVQGGEDGEDSEEPGDLVPTQR